MVSREEISVPPMAEYLRLLLTHMDPEPLRPGLVETPHRAARALLELTSGHLVNIGDLLKRFPYEGCDEMVLVQNIEFTSLCEHHLLPFFGKAHVAYLPDPDMGILGLSKIPRLVEAFARRLQVQERLTRQVTDAMDKWVTRRGSACVMRATHLCMACRGVKKPDATTVTSSLSGAFRDGPVRAELFALIGRV